MNTHRRICDMFWEDERWHVWKGISYHYCFHPDLDAEFFDTKQEALVRAAQMAEEVSTDRIEEITDREQIKAITFEIEDLSYKLRLLVNNGRQWETNFN